jgi:cation channel sperm-associated protein 3
MCNIITIAIETNANDETAGFFEMLDLVYLSIYTYEFFLRYYVETSAYWKSSYNLFDFLILVISYVQWILTITLGEGQNLTFLRVFRCK